MSDHDATAHAPDPVHHADGHDNGHVGHDGHDDAGTLGPFDWRMWGVGALGVIAALAVVAGWAIATDFAFLTVAH
jgi:hypothetical protein